MRSSPIQVFARFTFSTEVPPVDGLVFVDGSTCDVKFLFPFCFPRDFEVIQDGWTAFSVESEFSRLQAISDEWRISDVNKNFAVGTDNRSRRTQPPRPFSLPDL